MAENEQQTEQVTEGASEGDVVYFIAIRTSAPGDGSEVGAAISALSTTGAITNTAVTEAVAWVRDGGDLTAQDHDNVVALGLDPEIADAIFPVSAGG